MRPHFLVFLLASSLPVHAGQVIVGTPGELVAAQLGRDVGEAASAIMASRQSSVQRQSKIADLRARLAACGSCAEKASIERALQTATDSELSGLRQVDRMISDPALARVFFTINDPLGVLAASNQAIRQQAEQSRRNQDLVAEYCYATTDNDAQEEKCTLSIHEQDFTDSERVIVEKCGTDAPAPDCVKINSLTAVLQTTTARRCGMSTQDLAKPSNEVFARCHHPTRTAPTEKIASVVGKAGILDGGPMDDIEKSVLIGFDYNSVFLNWSFNGPYRTIRCAYHYAGETTSREETYWYVKAPPGVSDLLQLARSRLPGKSRLGLLNLGGIPVSHCPNTFDEAQKLKQSILSTPVPTDTGAIVPTEGLNNHRNIVEKFMGQALQYPEVQALRASVLGEQTRAPFPGPMPVLNCTYEPYLTTSAAVFYYWRDAMPADWPALQKAVHAVYALHRDWPPLVIPLGTYVTHNCPPTLAEAQSISKNLDQPGPAISR